MGILDWFRRKTTKPRIADAQGRSPFEQAKEILLQNKTKEDLLSAQMKEATVKLEKFEKISVVEADLPKPKRARTKKGIYKADDKSTPNVNEAWEGGKAPVKSKVKKAKPTKKTVKIKRVTKNK
tara:strand:+ start:2504 stop:2875 length:372 start_codon:yes stop_codon:yes gene_type:complete